VPKHCVPITFVDFGRRRPKEVFKGETKVRPSTSSRLLE
jgi:hypothetical protein